MADFLEATMERGREEEDGRDKIVDGMKKRRCKRIKEQELRF